MRKLVAIIDAHAALDGPIHVVIADGYGGTAPACLALREALKAKGFKWRPVIVNFKEYPLRLLRFRKMEFAPVPFSVHGVMAWRGVEVSECFPALWPRCLTQCV